MGFAASAPHVFPFAKSDGSAGGVNSVATIIVGLLRTDGFTWSPATPGIGIQTSILENDLGWGIGLYDGTLRAMIRRLLWLSLAAVTVGVACMGYLVVRSLGPEPGANLVLMGMPCVALPTVIASAAVIGQTEAHHDGRDL